MDEKGQLYALMGVAQEQQQAVAAIMAALDIQQAELARTVASSFPMPRYCWAGRE